MKLPGYLFCIMLFAACGEKKKSAIEVAKAGSTDIKKKTVKSVAFKSYQINNVYTVIDTGQYSNEGPMTGGSYAIIQRNGAVVDTIDLSYGIKNLSNNTYLYQTLKPEKERHQKLSDGELSLDEGDYTLIIDNIKLLLKDAAPNFDNYFSSPNALNHKIYFWQLEKMAAEDKDKISVAEFDPATRKTNTCFLLNDVLDTDDSSYFPLPYLEKDTIIFTMDGIKKWKFSSDFKAY